MKYLRRVLCLFLVVLLLVPTMVSCSLVKRFFGDEQDGDGAYYGGYTGEMVKDAYGFDRPQTCWITDCMILPEQPALTDLFGTGGEYGLANGELNAGKLVANEKNYLVCLYYGSLPYSDTPIGSYLDFTIVNGTEVLRGADCVSDLFVISWNGDLSKPSVDMRDAPDQRLSFENPGSNVLQGAIVIQFVPKVSGIFIAEFCLMADTSWENPDAWGDPSTTPYLVDSSEVINPNDANANPCGYVEYLSTSFLTEEAYNYGDYSENDIEYVASFKNGQNCYLLLDYAFTAEVAGNGDQKLDIIVFVPGRGMLDLRLEEAPTSETEKIVMQNGVAVCSVLTMPNEVGEQKTGRIVLRMNPQSGGVADICVLFRSRSQSPVEGNSYQRIRVTMNETPIKYVHSADKSYYLIKMAPGMSPVSVVVPDVTSDGTPVKAIYREGFLECATLKSVELGKNVVSIGDYAFWRCTALETLTFAGTMAEWEQIEKGESWKVGTKLTKVICSDGTVEI